MLYSNFNSYGAQNQKQYCESRASQFESAVQKTRAFIEMLKFFPKNNSQYVDLVSAQYFEIRQSLQDQYSFVDECVNLQTLKSLMTSELDRAISFLDSSFQNYQMLVL